MAAKGARGARVAHEAGKPAKPPAVPHGDHHKPPSRGADAPHAPPPVPGAAAPETDKPRIRLSRLEREKAFKPKRRFGHRPGFPAPTQEHIQQLLEEGRIELKKVKKIELTYQVHAPGSAGVRWFRVDKFPVIKHWCPQVETECKATEEPPKMRLYSVDDTKPTEFDVLGLREEGILALLVKHEQSLQNNEAAKKTPKV